MKPRNLFLWSLIMAPFFCYGQHIQYTDVFAPSEHLVKPEEKPFRDDICLNGSWQFQPVRLPQGFREGVNEAPALPKPQNDSWEETLIRIPSPWNVNSFADEHGQGGDFRTFPSYPKSWESVKMGWLRRNFKVPVNWNGKRLLLHFEALAGDAEIWINGKKAGTHFGIFLPFDIDVTGLINSGQVNEILVGVRKPSLFDKRGNYGRRTYQAGSFWGQHIAGIWQDVYLQALPDVYISNVYVKPDVQANQLQEVVTLKNETDKTVTVNLDAAVHQWQRNDGTEQALISNKLSATTTLSLPGVIAKVAAHNKTTITLNSPVSEKLKLWSPQNPDLYALLTHVKINGKVSDVKYPRFGWRSVTLQNKQVFVNGKPVILKGDSWHFLGIPQMTRRYAVAWFKAMRDANLNAVRLHAQPYPSFYMDVADEMGILVLDETAIWASDGGPKLDDSHYWQDTRQHLTELILRDRNHPSVFGWSVSNEVMPVVTNVMRNPPGVKDTLVKYYGIWANICRKLDPTRSWISADGEDDGNGQLPAYMVHYGGRDAMMRSEKSTKPWGVGEAGNAYYGTPEQVAETNGERAYESFLGRMEGVAESSYDNLVQQRQFNAVYRSVFNLVWYGLKPLPIGLRDTTKAPTLNDGVYFTRFKEDTPGVQPERLGPYSTTLNPGYDTRLPAYETWPLFDAIRDASADALVGADKWKHAAKQPVVVPAVKPVDDAFVLGGESSVLADNLKAQGVKLSRSVNPQTRLLFIDGIHPPSAKQKTLVDNVLVNGGTVMVWDADSASINDLNAVLPASLQITACQSSSLLPVKPDDLTEGIKPSDMYFAELKPAEIIQNGLAGDLVKQSEVLLTANNTDWLMWNKRPEYAKTAMIVRSEREAKSSGAAMILYTAGKGRLIVTTLPPASKLAKADRLVRKLLENLGLRLGNGNNTDNALLANGEIVKGLFISGDLTKTEEHTLTNTESTEIHAGAKLGDKTWVPVSIKSGNIEISKTAGEIAFEKAKTGYLSFWVSSSRSLEDLLAEPNIPVVNMDVEYANRVEVFLNGKTIINSERGKAKASELKLRRGWNHFLIKLVNKSGKLNLKARLTSDQPEFIKTLGSTIEKP